MLGVHPPMPVLDDQPCDNDVADSAVIVSERNHALTGACAIHHCRSIDGSQEGDQVSGCTTGEQLEGGVSSSREVKRIPGLGGVGGGLQALKRIPGAAIPTPGAGDDVQLAAQRIGLGLRTCGGGDGARLAAAVRVGQRRPQFIGIARFEEKRAGSPIVQAQWPVLDVDGRVRAHGRRAGMPGRFSQTAELQGHGAVQVLIAGYFPQQPDVVVRGVGAQLARDERLPRGCRLNVAAQGEQQKRGEGKYGIGFRRHVALSGVFDRYRQVQKDVRRDHRHDSG